MNLKFLRKISLSLLLMLLASTILFAQDRKVTGKVVDQADGQGIPGVNVSLKGVPSNVSTNSDGVFTIQVKSNSDVLVFSYIGYIRQQVTVGTQTNVTVKLVSENKNLEDVVVVGYGTQKRSHLTGSVVDIKASEVEDLPVSNIGAALAGRLLGVGVSGGTSRPGSTATLTVRNPNAIYGKDGGSQQPLYVIDDIVQLSQTGAPDNTLFNNLDPSEIESISVLKDGAAAVYGTRGGNGVVVIRTKRGKIGAPKISYSGNYSINDEAYRPKVLSAYQFGMYYNIMNGPNGAAAQPGNDNFFSQDELDYFKDHDYDWLEDAWKSSYNTRHTISVSGGTDKATYFGDVSYFKQDGNLASLDFQRWNFRAGSEVKVATNLKVGLQVSGNNSDLVKTFNKIGSELDDNDYRNLLLAPRYIPMYVNGYPVKLPGTTNDFSTYHFYEVEKLNNLNSTNTKTYTVNINVNYDIPFVKGLSARAIYGRNMGSTAGSQVGTKYNLYEFARLGTNQHIYDNAPLRTSPSPIVVASNGNRLYYSNINQSSTQSNLVLNYNRQFGKHNFSGLFTVEKSEQVYNMNYVLKADPIQSTNGQFSTATGAIDGATTKSEGGTLSYVGRANYSYNEKYLAEFLFRSDASTKFAPENYWGKFYSGSLGWVLSEENFLKNSKAVNFLKIRYSAGLLGNDQTKAWLWRQRYTFQDGKGAVFGDAGTTTGYKMEASPNRDATWGDEFKNNLGIDARFLNNRLSTTVEGYFNHAYNILVERVENVPVTVGGSVAAENYAINNLYGFEFQVGWNDKIGNDFTYGADLRMSWSDNKVIRSSFNANDVLYPWNPRNGTSSDVGKWGYDYIGMFHNQDEINAYVQQYNIKSVFGTAVTTANPTQLKPGMLYYRDVRGPLQPDGTFAPPDGIIDSNDQIQLAKKASNHYGYGMTFRAGYKGISAECVIAGSFGGWAEIDGRKKMNNSIARTFASVPSYWGDIYDPVLNPAGTMPNPNWEAISLTPTSNFWKVSAFRMRMTNFQINYRIPQKVLESLKISNARVFFTAVNPVNFYNPYTYRDSDAAFDVFPNLKTYSFGLNLTL
ncbi:SusC/RagA family TonB-linked outer membrane protein [Pedobacter sp. UBA5917]|jgi:TonB-linked SusC/RagA family outer membrane protein|uniref:SusC/RagA family TonB-linked outer membrane protein n=1 Tax=Pedobacter sp. UBA5917 TaxID=1947061 RepID=UPI00260045F7|nr:SusC/RagA family TonB-linked outer membrane protein [Pedobacter sp. UBA5917]